MLGSSIDPSCIVNDSTGPCTSLAAADADAGADAPMTEDNLEPCQMLHHTNAY